MVRYRYYSDSDRCLLLTYWQSSGQLISRTTSSLEQTCAAVQRTVSNLYPSSESKQQAVSNPELLYQAISESIRNKEHTLGGFWHIENGFMGYAVASSRGNSQDSQLAGAVQLAISSAARKAIADNKAAANVTEQLPIRVVVACPEKQHAGLAIWLSHPIQPVQNYFSVTASVLFVLLALIGVAIIVRESAFNRRWHKERDRIVNDAEDSKAVSVTSEIVKYSLSFFCCIKHANKYRLLSENSRKKLTSFALPLKKPSRSHGTFNGGISF